MSEQDGLGSVFISIRSSLARAVSKVVPPKEIEDIVQETYVRVCQVKNAENIKYPRSFLFKTAKNLALDYLKRAETKYTTQVEDDELNFSEDDRWQDEIYDRVASKEEFANFCESVRNLPVQCRRAFVMKKVYGYSQKEIAKELGISENTVEKHISTGIKRCTYFMMQKRKTSDTQSLTRSQRIKSVSVQKGRQEETGE